MHDGRSVKSTKNMFAITELLCERNGAGITELATELGLAKSTVFNHLNTMREHGYVAKRDGEYYAGLQFFVTGNRVRRQHALYEASKLELEELSEETGESTWCVKRENGRVISINGYAPNTSLNSDAAIGTSKPIHCTASGKAILADLPPEEVDSIVETYGLAAISGNTITDVDELHRSLELTHERGYALNLGEELEGYNSVGVSISTSESGIVGGISVGGAAHRLSREHCEETLAPLVMATANDIEINLAYE